MYGWAHSMSIALWTATHSSDPSTQNAAVIIGAERVISAFNDFPTADRWERPLVISAFNDFPKGVECAADRWERPAKYDYVEHAERAAIYMAARRGVRTAGATMVCPWAACPDCARAIVAAGIVRLVRYPHDDQGHWAARVAVGDQILKEGGVTIVEDWFDGLDVPPLRRNGQQWMPHGGVDE